VIFRVAAFQGRCSETDRAAGIWKRARKTRRRPLRLPAGHRTPIPARMAKRRARQGATSSATPKRVPASTDFRRQPAIRLFRVRVSKPTPILASHGALFKRRRRFVELPPGAHRSPLARDRPEGPTTRREGRSLAPGEACGEDCHERGNGEQQHDRRPDPVPHAGRLRCIAAPGPRRRSPGQARTRNA
jgi:hypothetical protein